MSKEGFILDNDIHQLISYITGTFSSNKQIFLSALFSHACHALDKIKHKAMTECYFENEPCFRIRAVPDKINKTLTIIDTGIGMTKQELNHSLGRIVNEEVQSSIDSVQDAGDIEAKPQFNARFYLVFLVAEKVTVISKSDEEKQYKCECSSDGKFHVSDDDENVDQLTRGTKVILYPKDDALEFLEEENLRVVLKKYSHFGFPVQLQVEKIIEKEVNEEFTEEEKKRGDLVRKEKKKVKEVVSEWENIEVNEPIWTREQSEITNEEYSDFYQLLTSSFEDYFAMKHYYVEGSTYYKVLIYIPKRSSFDLLESNKKKGNIKLYVNKVYVMDHFEELIPEYLDFVTGVIDSEDLPLSTSRESLKESSVLRLMRRSVTRKVIGLIEEISEDNEAYKRFYADFASNIKTGICQDSVNRARLIQFLRFFTSKSGDEQVPLNDYVNRMKEGQKVIYFITGESRSEIEDSAAVQVLKKKDYEVIYMIDSNDKYLIQEIKEYDSRELKNCIEEGLDLENL